MLHFGPISSVFDLSTFVFMWWGLHANRPELQTLFQSGWFLVGLMTQMLVVHVVRTRRLPFVQSHASAVLITMTGLMSLIGLALTQGPWAGAFKLTPLPASYFPFLGAVLLAYVLLAQGMKTFYIRRYGGQ